jgi:hypothetical protein
MNKLQIAVALVATALAVLLPRKAPTGASRGRADSPRIDPIFSKDWY